MKWKKLKIDLLFKNPEPFWSIKGLPQAVVSVYTGWIRFLAEIAYLTFVWHCCYNWNWVALKFVFHQTISAGLRLIWDSLRHVKPTSVLQHPHGHLSPWLYVRWKKHLIDSWHDVFRQQLLLVAWLFNIIVNSLDSFSILSLILPQL